MVNQVSRYTEIHISNPPDTRLKRYRHINLIGHTLAVARIVELRCERSTNTYTAHLKNDEC
jgi:hypothetical protein